MAAGGRKFKALSAFVALSSIACSAQAATHAHRHGHRATVHHVSYHAVSAHAASHHAAYHHASSAYRHYSAIHGARVIQCVAFAKRDAGIQIAGNARDWWGNAAGIYERGSRPEPGSVLSFRANGRMPLGHVAVVSRIADSRTIVIDQSHWISGGITRDIEVKDVSENNDWTAVRVQLGHGGGFGSIYPTHGFIYPRPDKGEVIANDSHAPMPTLAVAPADLRGHHVRFRHADMEVAEAPQSARALDLSVPGISFDAPNRALR
jgi:surface antigen